jgi:hypothetical protein
LISQKSVKVVHPKNDEEAWWPLFGETLFPALMAGLDEIKLRMATDLMFRRDHEHRKSSALLP